MPSTRITKRAVDDATPEARDFYLWDSELSGFGLKVTPSGTKTYLVQYRAGGRGMPTRRITIGRHGSPWTPEQARQEARRVLATVDLGDDPAARKADRRRELTVSELCDLYIAEGCTTKKPSAIRADQGRITWHIKPLLGKGKPGTSPGVISSACCATWRLERPPAHTAPARAAAAQPAERALRRKP